jgi:hypothetical protein
LSGYLQRMALSVLKPEVAIHPVVGSIFSTPKPRDSSESFTELDNVATTERREFLRESLSTTETSSSSPSRSISGVRAVPHDIEATQPRTAAATTPSGVVSGDRLSRRADTVRSASVKPDMVVPVDNSANLSAKIVEHDASPVTRKFTPLMPAVLAPNPQSVALRPPAKPGDNAAQSLAAQSRMTDDIEIHIGRIEVAAMQAAPIRSAPAKPPRRAASLDEYLKRRDGITS